MIDRSKFGLNRIICPSFDVVNFFQLANELGLNYVELRNDLPYRDIIDSLSATEIRYLVERYNLKVCTINALQKFNNLEESRKIKDDLTYLSDVAKSMNCPAIVMCPLNIIDDFRTPSEQFRDTVNMLKELAPIFENNKIIGYIEPLGFKSSSLSSVITAMKAVEESEYKEYRIVIDTFHHAIGPDNLEKLSNEYDIKLTGIIHISAVTSEISREEYKDENRNIDFVNDKLKSKAQIEYFVKNGYDGIISFEPFARDLQQLDKEELKNIIDKAIKYLTTR